ncbi:MAG: phage holin family protein [Phocaeicola sp.]
MIERFFNTYGFDGFKGFTLSLFPSFKYGHQGVTISLSAILAIISKFIGVSPIIVFVMFVAVLVETFTGTRASQKVGIPFESFRFSRCVIKVFIWVFLFFMFHNFSQDMATKSGWVFILGSVFFDILHLATMIYFCIEYTTSILENFAVLDGKPKDTFINYISILFTALIDKLKSFKE